MFFSSGFGGFPGMDEDFGGGGRRGGGSRKDVDTQKFYDLLEVDKNASAADIKKAYRKLAVKHHPDKGGDAEFFKEITKAYETLSDDDKRKKYDKYGEEGLEGGGGGDPTDIFDMVFGGGGRSRGGGGGGKRKGKDVTHPIEVTLEQVYAGHTKKLAINRTVIDQAEGVKDCEPCNGRGQIVQVMRMGNMIQQVQQKCGTCSGSGKIYKTKKEKEVLEVYVDRGAPHGHKITFYGKADEHPGYEAGDVHFEIGVKEHPVFRRVQADLFIKKKITLLEALTGATIEVTHLDGRKLLLKTQPGEVITPPPTGDVKWEVFEDTDCPGDDVAKCQVPQDINKLKEVCEQKNFSGFVIDGRDNMAYFRQLTRDEWINNKRSNKATKGMKVYVTPDPILSAQFRMKKAVKDEGLPLFKNPMARGNLFVDIEIEFPTEISGSTADALKSLLPGPDPMSLPDDTVDHEHVFLTDMDPVASEKAAAHAYEADDDDDDMRGGGQGGVQCAQQ